MSKAHRRISTRIGVSATASLTAIAALAGGATVANPAPARADDLPAISSTNPQDFLNQARDQFNEFARTASDRGRTIALDWRNSVYQNTEQLDPNAANWIRTTVDGWINAIWPNAIADQEAQQAAARDAAARAAEEQARQAAEAEAAQRAAEQNAVTAPCEDGAEACVNLGARRSWLTDGHMAVTYGPVPITAGAPGQETTPGWHKVLRKVKDEVSHEFNNAPMPYSVYFTNSGMAFHEGSLNRESAGCIHLSHQDAEHYFNTLQVGDDVFIF